LHFSLSLSPTTSTRVPTTTVLWVRPNETTTAAVPAVR
jgi:hypothetical protein